MKTDFFDKDLARQTQDPSSKGQADHDAVMPSRPVSDINIGALAEHREKAVSQAASAAEEIERLKRRQEELELAKRTLDELRRKEDKYEQGKREMIERLSQSIVVLEQRQVQAVRMAEATATTRTRFGELLAELHKINENSWVDKVFEEELTKSLALVENARMEYNKAMAKVESLGFDKEAGVDTSPVFKGFASSVDGAQGITQWMKIGLGVSLPLIIVAVVLFVIYFFIRGTIVLR